MTRSIVVVALGVAVAAAGATFAFAAQNPPGMPTLAQVLVINRDADAVPVKVPDTGEPLPVRLAGDPTVSLTPNAHVATRSARQVWEYRRIVVPVGDDATPALSAAGLEGWEAIAALTVEKNVVWTLKRPR